MDSIALQAITAALNGKKVFCKFLSANDTGMTGTHQEGIYIAKPAISILFDQPGQRGENKDKWVEIRWQGDFSTQSRFIYYGKGTRNEYRSLKRMLSISKQPVVLAETILDLS